VFEDHHPIVMVIIIEETAKVSRCFATMTVMTLVTLIYGRLLDGGGDHVLHDS
jgi:hypothetical protein